MFYIWTLNELRIKFLICHLWHMLWLNTDLCKKLHGSVQKGRRGEMHEDRTEAQSYSAPLKSLYNW